MGFKRCAHENVILALSLPATTSIQFMDDARTDDARIQRPIVDSGQRVERPDIAGKSGPLRVCSKIRLVSFGVALQLRKMDAVAGI